jgi:DNA-binding NarL/FixJ family response regulator
VKCIVVTDCDDVADRFRRQVVENKGRKDMSLRDDAFAAKQMQDNGDADKTAAVAMCLSVSRLRNIRKMTVLSDDAWAHIKAGSINAGVAEYAAGAVPAEQLNALVLRCVGKNRKQAAAIVGNFVSEMNQASFELACESAGVKQKQADLAKLLAQQILQVAGTVAQLKGHHHRTFARTLSKEIAALVPNSKQTANGLLFIQRVMNDVGVNLADRKN